jgi:hypothetical protein
MVLPVVLAAFGTLLEFFSVFSLLFVLLLYGFALLSQTDLLYGICTALDDVKQSTTISALGTLWWLWYTCCLRSPS